jgi:hypothetical protein
VANLDVSSRLTLPENPEALRAFAQTLLQERNQYQRQLEEQRHRAEEQSRHTAQLQTELLRLQVELARSQKWSYGPRADRLRPPGDLAQLLLNWAAELARQPVPAVESEPSAEPAERRVRRRKGRRDLARFENLPVTTHVYELSEAERACPGCGQTRREIGADESWQGRIHPGPLRAPAAPAQEVRLPAL